MIKREDFINEVLNWTGTPFKHQGRKKGVGCDCLGLILGAGRNVGLTPYNDSVKYSHFVHSPTLIENLRKYLKVIKFEESIPGDIFLFSDRDNPTHLGIKTDKGFIHSCARYRKVVNQIMDEEWRKKVVLTFRFSEFE